MSPAAWKVERANADCLESARKLLTEADLPVQGLEQAELWCAKDSTDRTIGLAGLETWGKQGLLRSVVVDSEHRGSGVGKAIVERVLREAKAKGVDEVYLLTDTAPRFFERFGFKPVARMRIKGRILESVEFREVCPTTEPMKLVLS